MKVTCVGFYQRESKMAATLSCMVLFILSFIANQTVLGKRVCFYTGWTLYRDMQTAMAPEDIDPYMCTHIVFAFGTTDDTGTKLRAVEGYKEMGLYRRLHGLRDYNDDLYFMISLGGWGMDSTLFSKLLSSEKNMEIFAKETMVWLRANDFDGLDINWQYPGTRGSPPEDVERFFKFLRLLQWEFVNEFQPDSKSTLLLTLTVNPTIERATLSYDLERYVKYVNWINFQMYDLYGHWDDSMMVQHHSPLTGSAGVRNVNDLCKYWVTHGIPHHKIVLGVPFYGRSYTLENATEIYPGSRFVGPGADNGDGYPVSVLCHLIKNGAKEHLISDENVPFMAIGNEWIGYDNPASIKEKAAIVANNHLGGIAVWSIDMDDWRGACGPKYPMMNAIIDGLGIRRSYESHRGIGLHDKANADLARNLTLQTRAEGWAQQDQADAEALAASTRV